MYNRVAVWIGYYWILSVYLQINEFSGGQIYGNNDTLYKDTKYRNSSHKVCLLEVILGIVKAQ